MTSTEALRDRLYRNLFQGYSYGYPHKSAYRALTPPVPLKDLWDAEDRSALFGYLHLPFCEMRCGFCNLFTTGNPDTDQVEVYLTALARQVRSTADWLGGHRFARFAVGGGTPTYLTAQQLGRVLDLVTTLGLDPARVPTSVETSPATATPDRLELLRDRGVERISIGVQSMVEAEAHAAGRPQHQGTVERALDDVRRYGPAVLNVDLMYGLPGQSTGSWLASLRRTLDWAPQEIFCYPLYVRPLTGIHRRHGAVTDHRLQMYRVARDFLRDAGYRQTSMRRFVTGESPALGRTEPEYSCADDGMLGLGVGARSYTRALHYCTEYAVSRPGVKSVIAQYCRTDAEGFAQAVHGIALDGAEQRRRYFIQSILHADGLDFASYTRRFTSSADDDLPELRALRETGLIIQQDGVARLTETGMELSDAIGPWLASDDVRRRSEEYQPR